MRCFHGPKMKELLVMSDIMTLQEKPPWVSNMRCILIVFAGFRARAHARASSVRV